MKVQLLLDNPGDIRSGYICIDPLAPDDDQHGRVRGDVADLSHTVDDAEADDVLALDILDFFAARDVDTVLGNWLRKLSRGGKLTLSVVDIREVSRAIIADKLSIEDANELIHGRQQAAWEFRKSVYSMSQLVDVLTNLGYKILSKKVENYRAVVTAQRV